MDGVTGLGRFFFAFSMLAFGVQQFLYEGFIAGLGLTPERIPWHSFWAYLTGALLMFAGVCIGLGRRTRLAALGLGLLFFVCLLVRRGPGISVILHDISARTVVFETLTICGGALVLAHVAPPEPASVHQLNNIANKLASPGRYFIAVSTVIFGIDHFQVAGFVARLIPAWIPGHLFWAYFTGVGFVAAGLAIALGKQLRLASTLLGLMFLLWVVLLHAPRVAASLHNGNEWNSAFVALAMSGCALLAGGLREREIHTAVDQNSAELEAEPSY